MGLVMGDVMDCDPQESPSDLAQRGEGAPRGKRLRGATRKQLGRRTLLAFNANVPDGQPGRYLAQAGKRRSYHFRHLPTRSVVNNATS